MKYTLQELQALRPRTATSYQETGLQEQLIPQRVSNLQGICPFNFCLCNSLKGVQKGRNPRLFITQIQCPSQSPEVRMNSVSEEKEATVSVWEWKRSQSALAWLKLPAGTKGLGTHRGEEIGLSWGFCYGVALLNRREVGFFRCEVKQLWLYKPPMCTAITKRSSALRPELHNTHREAGKETSSKVTKFPAAAELLRTSKWTGKR